MPQFNDLPSALKNLVENYGVNILRTQAFINMLDDYHFFNERAYLKNTLKIFLNEGLVDYILNSSKGEEEEIRILDRIESNYAFKENIARYLVESLRYGVGLRNTLPSLTTENNSPSTRYSSSIPKPPQVSTPSSSSSDKNDDSLKFMGLKLGCSYDEMDKRLRDKGFHQSWMSNSNDTVKEYKGGVFQNLFGAIIKIYLTEHEKMVFKVEVVVSDPSEEILKLLQIKYNLCSTSTYSYSNKVGNGTIVVNYYVYDFNITYEVPSLIALDRDRHQQAIKDRIKDSNYYDI